MIFWNHFILIFIISAISYAIGCINTSLAITKILKIGNDIRSVGSGNAGFTNVLRTMGKKMAIFTFLGDFLKGILAVWITSMIVMSSQAFQNNENLILSAKYISGMMCVIGHIYPCFFKFKGGQGVLTTWATMFLIDWRVAIVLITVFLITLLITKIVSLASVMAAISYPISTFLICFFSDYLKTRELYSLLFPTIVSFIVGSLVLYKHKSNIARLLNGEEKKISVHKK
ncbi:MAG: glycerol-3-phosphate 1-O-acyltransferase PlsY [Clostridia bacterium]|nr:glycerol-3-phosphate 1-O-acyltransferase PlsY [Clostridia bacterium]